MAFLYPLLNLMHWTSPKRRKEKGSDVVLCIKQRQKESKPTEFQNPKESEISCQSGVINESNTKITKTHLNSKTQLQNNKKKKGISSVS